MYLLFIFNLCVINRKELIFLLSLIDFYFANLQLFFIVQNNYFL